jgi:hypothetical protein
MYLLTAFMLGCGVSLINWIARSSDPPQRVKLHNNQFWLFIDLKTDDVNMLDSPAISVADLWQLKSPCLA